MQNSKLSSLSLQEIAKKYDTDKGTAHKSYLGFYESILSPVRDLEFNFLEIGTAHGGSVKMWREYFLNATVFSMEHPRLAENAKSIFNTKPTQKENIFKSSDLENTFICIANSTKEEAQGLFEQQSVGVVVDDGDHDAVPQIMTFLNLLQSMTPGGFYIIEDIKGPLYTSGLNNFSLICEFLNCFKIVQMRIYSPGVSHRKFADNNIIAAIMIPDNEEDYNDLVESLNNFTLKYFKTKVYSTD